MTATNGAPIYSSLVQANGRIGPLEDTIRVTLSDQDGHLAEVQVAYYRGGLVVIAAGHTYLDRDARGFARVRVEPE